MSEIDKLRNRMNDITLEMIKLLNDRISISKEIGNLKKNQGLGITDEAREEQLRSKVTSLCKEINLEDSIGIRFLNHLLNESIKVQSINKETHLSVFLRAKSLEQQGEKIIHMEVGEPDFPPPIEVKQSLNEVYEKGFGKYGPSKGLSQFRSAIAKKNTELYETDIEYENVIVCPGARFAVFLAITTLLKPGDEIIVIEPAWPAYQDCALNSGVKVRTIKTTLENKWEPSVEDIKKVINSNTKMIVLNYPNNPTGKILPQELQDQIIKVAINHNLYVLSDEIYAQYSYYDWKSILRYNYEKSIVTQSFSKSHSMTGYRIGYAIANSQIIEKMGKLQALCLTNVSEPIQYVAQSVLNADTTSNSKIVKSKLDLIISKAKEMGLDFIEPKGALYLFARINIENFDSLEFSNRLLESGVAVAPGTGFGDYKNFIRISACQEEKKLIEGMNTINRLLKNKR